MRKTNWMAIYFLCLATLLIVMVGCNSTPAKFQQGQFVRLKLIPEGKLLIIRSSTTIDGHRYEVRYLDGIGQLQSTWFSECELEPESLE